MKRYYHMLKIVCSLALSVPFATTAHAQLDEKMQRFLTNNQDYVQALGAYTQGVYEQSPIQCDTLEGRDRLVPDILSRVVFPDKEVQRQNASSGDSNKKNTFPQRGQWIEHIRQRGCDIPSQINVLAVALPNRVPQFFPMKNGTTRTDPLLQQRVEEKAREFAVLGVDDCVTSRAAPILDTRFEGYFDNEQGYNLVKDDTGFGWQERWTLLACDTVVETKIHILPDDENPGDYKVLAGLYGGDMGVSKEEMERRRRYRDVQ
tara:strand:+ start:840 stop:1622 length:783 start_codon:yes stop_codon:yes gene_type:complete